MEEVPPIVTKSITVEDDTECHGAHDGPRMECVAVTLEEKMTKRTPNLTMMSQMR